MLDEYYLIDRDGNTQCIAPDAAKLAEEQGEIEHFHDQRVGECTTEHYYTIKEVEE